MRKVTVDSGSNITQIRLYVGQWEVYRKSDSTGLLIQRETIHVMDDSSRIAVIDSPTGGSAIGSEVQLLRYQYSNHLGTATLEVDDSGSIISYEEYYAYGGTSFQSGRSVAEVSLKRYRYIGKERDDESGFYYMGARYYAPWLCRWTAVDPINNENYNIVHGQPNRNTQRHFLELTASPYEYCYANPIKFTDLSGEQAVIGLIPLHPKTPLGYINRGLATETKRFSETRTGKVLSGAWTTAAGTAGVISSVSYIAGTDGVGAALGGTVALQFSFGTMAIGTSQMIDAIFAKTPHDVLQKSVSIPGLIANGANSKYAPFIDAAGGLIPAVATSGSFQQLVKNGFGIGSALRDFNNTPNVIHAIALFDQVNTNKGFVLETLNLTSEVAGDILKQHLDYRLSYSIKKGDTLEKIAKALHTDVQTLSRQNGISNPNDISVGQKIIYKKTVDDAKSLHQNRPR